ncbi:MAG: autotransporter outer membrane beta-barrel domain-containing protein, partial [Clostridia bacterium]
DHGHAVWARTQTSTLDAGVVSGQIDLRVQTDVVQLGAEKRLAVGEGRVHIGVTGGYGRATTEAMSLVSRHRATGTVKGSMAGLYGTWFQQADGAPGAYVDVVAQYARFDNTVKGSYLGREQYDARSWSLSLETGRAFQLHAGKRHGVYLEPQVQVIHTGFSSGDVREANGTLVLVILATITASYRKMFVVANSTASDEQLQQVLGFSPNALKMNKSIVDQNKKKNPLYIPQLKRTLDYFYDLEFAFKSGKISQESALDLAIAKLVSQKK